MQTTPIFEIVHDFLHFNSMWPNNQPLENKIHYNNKFMDNQPIVNNLLHMVKLQPCVSLQIAQDMWTSIGMAFQYFVFYFIRIGLNLLIILRRVDFNILKFSTHQSFSYSMNKNLETRLYFMGSPSTLMLNIYFHRQLSNYFHVMQLQRKEI